VAGFHFVGKNLMGRRAGNGSALLFVTLFGVLLVLLAAVLIGVSSGILKSSYGLNRQLVCRNAAEGALQVVMFRLNWEASQDQEGWFGAARQQSDPVFAEAMTGSPLLNGAAVGPESSDRPTVKISIYDSEEASDRFGLVLGDTDYIVEAKASLDSHSSTLYMRARYEVSPGGSSSSSASDLFSKYLIWSSTGRLSPVPGEYEHELTDRYDGLLHFEGDVRIQHVISRSAMPVTATGAFLYFQNTTTAQMALFDWNDNQALDTTARPEFQNLSEAQAQAQSGGGKPSVPQPDYGEVEARFLAEASAQSAANPSLRALWIDPSNPAYAPGGPMYVGTISNSTVQLSYSAGASATVASITVYGNLGSRSTPVSIPVAVPTVLYTTAPISSLRGSYFANLTIASTYSGTATTVSQYGAYNNAPYNLPRLPTLGAPAVKVTDHLISVDQSGVPKFWPHDGRGAKLPAPGRLGLSGVPQNDLSGTNLDSYSTENEAWTFRRHESYNPSSPSVLGIYSRGDTLIETPYSNHLGMWAHYGSASGSRLYPSPSQSKGYSFYLGSMVSPGFPYRSWIYVPSDPRLTPSRTGFWKGNCLSYDSDLLVTPPPYWILPATQTASSQPQVTALWGSISTAPYR
jgi:hypothetical protein